MYLSLHQPWVVVRCHNLVVLSGPRVLCHEAKQDFENVFCQLHEVGWKCLFGVRQRNQYVAFDRAIKLACSYRWCHLREKRFFNEFGEGTTLSGLWPSPGST
jgi:hypothetical protein